jgi:hypothetical protein
MGFTTPCFIRKNTPELRSKLEELGYEPNAYESFWEDDNRYIITTIGSQGYSYYTLCIKNCCLLENELFIDCGTNEELFLALAALRDDSDYMQWFMSPKTRPKISPGYCGQIVGMDGHYKEIVGYEWYRYENKDNALTEKLNAMVQMEAEDMEFEPHKSTVEELIEHFKR